jgi:hypothetical protein
VICRFKSGGGERWKKLCSNWIIELWIRCCWRWEVWSLRWGYFVSNSVLGNPALHRSGHRLHMDLDLQSLFGLHVRSCINWQRPRNNPPPPTPHLGSYTRGRYWSAKIGDISLWPSGSGDHK